MKRQPTVYFAHKPLWRLAEGSVEKIKKAILADPRPLNKECERAVRVDGSWVRYSIEVAQQHYRDRVFHNGWINVDMDSVPEKFWHTWCYYD